MTGVVWDQIDDRRYFNGVDKGVLYLPNGLAIPWNGLVGVTEDTGTGTTEPLYFDGVKYLDVQNTGVSSLTLRARVYPREFEQFEGYDETNNGLRLDAQSQIPRFNLSYRTQHDRGYRIHIWYNLTATPDTRAYQSTNQTINPLEFSWVISGIPVELDGFSPTEHFIFDSEFLSSAVMNFVERTLYGDEFEDASLPAIEVFIDVATNWNAQDIVLQPSGVHTLVADGNDLAETEIDGFFRILRESRLVETDLDGLYVLEEES